MTCEVTRLLAKADRIATERVAERNRMADDIRAIRAMERLSRFNLFAPIETKTERFTLSLGWCCLIGCAVFGWVYL